MVRPRGGRRGALRASVAAITLLLVAPTHADIDKDLEELRYVRGLVDLRLAEVLETYLRTNPPTDDIGRRLHEVHRQRMHLATLDPTHDDRRAELQRLLQLQRNLIQRHGRSPLASIWRLDLATDLTFGRAVSEVATITTLVGLPSDGERAEAHSVANEILSLTAETRAGFQDLLLACETMAVETDDLTWTMLRDRLAREEGAIRLPVLEGLATSIIERAKPEHSSTTDLEVAAARLNEAADLAEGTWAILGRIHAAMLWSLADDANAARAALDHVLDDPRLGSGERLLALLAQADTARRHERASAAEQAIDMWATRALDASPADLLAAVLFADQRFLLRIAESASPDRAIEAYLQLESISSLPREETQVIALERLSRVAESLSWDSADLPPIVRVARARAMLRGSNGERERAREILSEVIARPDAGDDAAVAAALYELGKATMADGDPAVAIELLRRLAVEHPTSPDAERAIEAALVASASRHRSAPNDPALRSELDTTLAIVLDRYTNLATIDRWRYEAGRLAWTDGDLATAGAWFAKVGGDTSWHADAWFMRVRIAMRMADEAPDASTRRRQLDAGLEVIAEARRAITRDIDRGVIREDRLDDASYYLACLRIFEAESEITLGHAERAIEVLEGIEQAPGVNGTALGRAMRARIDAYRDIGRPAGAAESIRSFLEADPEGGRRAVTALLATLQVDVVAAIEECRDEDARRLAERNLLPVARVLEASMEAGRVDATSVMTWLHVADALRYAGEFADARRLYDRLADSHGASLQVLVGQAESLVGLGRESDYAEAMGIYRRIAAAGESQVGDAFWLAQWRMLQILDRTGRNTDRIAPRILQLRQRDPELGTERVRRGMEALGAKYQ